MADEFADVPEGGDGQDVCSFFASLIHQRQSVERLLNWLRESQTTCTDSNCFDDINGLPGSEIGSPLNQFGGHGQSQNSDTDAFSLVLWFVVGILTLYAMNLARDRGQAQYTKKSISPRNASHEDDDDHHDHTGPFGRRDGDDHSSPAV